MCLRSFWKYVKKLDRREARRYLEMFYILRLRPLIAQARTCMPSSATAGQAQPLVLPFFGLGTQGAACSACHCSASIQRLPVTWLHRSKSA